MQQNMRPQIKTMAMLTTRAKKNPRRISVYLFLLVYVTLIGPGFNDQKNDKQPAHFGITQKSHLYQGYSYEIKIVSCLCFNLMI